MIRTRDRGRVGSSTRTKKRWEKMKAKLGALAVVALMLMVAVPAVSAGPFEEARERYQTAREAFQSAYTDWLSAKADFIQARVQWRQDRTDANLANVVEKAKISLLKADNLMIRRLEALRVRVEATRGLSDNEKAAIYAEIDADISWLEGKQADIQAADSVLEIITVASEIWNYWRNVAVRIKQIIGQMLSAWVDALLQRAEAFAGRVEARIEELKDNGIDTSALESWLADYESKLALAEQKYDAAKDKFSKISSVEDANRLFWEGLALIREGNRYLRDAFRSLRDIVSDMRNRGHRVTLRGSGTLVAQGNGRAYISGTGGVRVRALVEGNMIVSPEAGVITDGQGTITELDNGWVKYQGFGRAIVVGTNMVVDINGNGIDIVARGSGTVTLTGNGTYRTFGENFYMDGTWTEVGVTATLATGATTTG